MKKNICISHRSSPLLHKANIITQTSVTRLHQIQSNTDIAHALQAVQLLAYWKHSKRHVCEPASQSQFITQRIKIHYQEAQLLQW